MIEEFTKEFIKRFHENKKKELQEIMVDYGHKYKEEISRRKEDEYYRNESWDNSRDYSKGDAIKRRIGVSKRT